MLGTRLSRHDQTNTQGDATLLAGTNLNPSLLLQSGPCRWPSNPVPFYRPLFQSPRPVPLSGSPRRAQPAHSLARPLIFQVCVNFPGVQCVRVGPCSPILARSKTNFSNSRGTPPKFGRNCTAYSSTSNR